jgi:hypothetical protein
MHPNDRQFIPGPNRIFVFGSNDAGVHGAGAAKFALDTCGATWGIGEGLMGNSYAIPTKDRDLNTKLLGEINVSVSRFLYYAQCNPQLQFFVTRIGCGLAGYNDRHIAPLFAGAPPNVELPHGWDDPESLE